jgi:hypothetical protein
MKNLFTGLLLIVVCGLMSCTAINSKNNIRNLESIVNKAENNYKSYSDKDWEKSDKSFDEVSTKILSNKSDYSEEQLDKANSLIGKYQGLKIKAGLNVFKEALHGFGNQIEGAVNALTDSTK